MEMARAACLSNTVPWLRIMSGTKIYGGASEIYSPLCDSGGRPSEAPATAYYTVLRLADFQSVRETHFLFSFSSLSITCYPRAVGSAGVWHPPSCSQDCAWLCLPNS